MNCDIWTTYAEFNDWLRREGRGEIADYSERNTADNLALIVGVYKWTYNGCGDRPEWPERLGYKFVRHDPIAQKYDVFIYTR